MAQPTPLSSNNPFRRNGAGASTPATAPPPLEIDAQDISLPAAPSPSSSDRFLSHLQALPQPAHPPPATSFQKPKVVKKVRVQSPPPSSPESAGIPDGYPRADRYEEESDASEDEEAEANPFTIIPRPPSIGSEENEQSEGEDPPVTSHRTPPNPFQKTLHDLELGLDSPGQDPATLSAGRAALDVDAFKRLLLTGEASGPITSTAAAGQQQPTRSSLQTGDGTKLMDSPSLSRQSIPEASTHPPAQETPRVSHEAFEPDVDSDRHGLVGSPRSKPQSPPTPRKKPPPPSSRHGKLIKVESKVTDRPEGARRTSTGSSTSSLASPPSLQEPQISLEAEKLLPVASQNAVDKSSDGALSQEAAENSSEPVGKEVAECIATARPPTPPKGSHSIQTSPSAAIQPTKKPPPPPRRQPHGRSESKASVLVTAASPTSAHHSEERDLSARRSSQDSTRSRSSSLRVSVHAPAPPPPRRPNHHSRPSASFISPSSASFSSLTPSGSERSPSELPEFSPLPTPSLTGEVSTAETPTSASAGHGAHLAKQLPPPPPPARNASTRTKRPSSISSIEAPSRRTSGHAGLPPPPPPRQRGSSKGSVDGVAVGAKPSVGAARILEGTFAEEPEGAAVGRSPVDAGVTTDILADLTALKREVDALRGKVEKAAPEA